MPWTELQYSRGEKSGVLFGAGSRSRFWFWYAGDVVTWPLSLARPIWIGECAVHRDRGSQPEFLNFVLWALGPPATWNFLYIVIMHSVICFALLGIKWRIYFNDKSSKTYTNRRRHKKAKKRDSTWFKDVLVWFLGYLFLNLIAMTINYCFLPLRVYSIHNTHPVKTKNDRLHDKRSVFAKRQKINLTKATRLMGWSGW